MTRSTSLTNRGLTRSSFTVASVWILAAALTVSSGCASTRRNSMSGYLSAVPQMRWPGTRDNESDEEPRVVAPSVSANVAQLDAAAPSEESGDDIAQRDGLPDEVSPSLDAPANSKVSAGLTNREEKLIENRADSKPEPQRRWLAGFVDLGAKDRDSLARERDAGARQTPSTDGNSEQIERLKEALSEDVRRSDEPERTATATRDVRARVDSLLERARRLVAYGELAEARRSARLAQDMGDSAKLDYAPDEERPVDLVHRIDEQILSESAATPEVNSGPVAIPANGFSGDQSSGEKHNQTASASGDDGVGSPNKVDGKPWTWMKGYGVGALRRDRKAMLANTTQNGDQISAEAPSELGNAVVQANRSVSLSGGERFSRDRTASSELIAADQSHRIVGMVEIDSNPLLEEASTDSTSKVEMPPGRFNDESRENSAAFTAATSNDAAASQKQPTRSRRSSGISFSDSFPARIEEESPQLTPAETAPPPPEFDDVRPLPESRSLAGPTKASRSFNGVEHQEPRTTTHWRIAAVLFAICTVAAFVCYRRGAT